MSYFGTNFSTIYIFVHIYILDINECTTGTDDCSANAVCTNTVGGFYCTCNPGFVDVNGRCFDINDCADNPCGQNGKCIDGTDAYSCNCDNGYEFVNWTCRDINECIEAVFSWQITTSVSFLFSFCALVAFCAGVPFGVRVPICPTFCPTAYVQKFA